MLSEHMPQLLPYHFTGNEVKTLEFLITVMLDDQASFEFPVECNSTLHHSIDVMGNLLREPVSEACLNYLIG